jgi:K+-dependent Na+/Ca+ exchanger-like protein
MAYAEIFSSVAARARISEKSYRRLVRKFAGLLLVFSIAHVWTKWHSPPLPVALSDAEEALDQDEHLNPSPWEPQWRQLQQTCEMGACVRTTGGNCTIPDCEGVCVSRQDQADADSLDSSFTFLEMVVKLKDPSKPQLENPAMMFVPIFGILYMFAGLAIVCDEFFVPALECFVDEFGISMDVAGATFMAAGGSMPELFTSFIATFDKSEVGFAAIVGSAVFNVLFVIAVCAIASTETLSLTWWPLARDCSCYLVALITTAIVFKFNGKAPEGEIPDGVDESKVGVILWWEALILLFEYIAYCSFMKKNQAVYLWVEKQAARWQKPKVAPEEPAMTKSKSDVSVGEFGEKNSNFGRPSTFRKGIVQLLTQNAYLYETAGIAAVTQISGNLEETFKRLDKDNDGTLSIDEVKELLSQIGVKQDSASVKTALRRINRNGEDEITFEAFKRWYIASEARIEVEINRVFTELDTNHNGTIEQDEIEVLLRKLGHNPSDEDMKKLMEELAAQPTSASTSPTTSHHAPEKSPASGKDLRGAASATSDANSAPTMDVVKTGTSEPEASTHNVSDAASSMVMAQTTTDPNKISINAEQFELWYRGTLFYQNKMRSHELEEDAADQGLSLEAPDNGSKGAMAWYVFTYPLCAVMYCSLPDVRTPKWQRNSKVAILEFTLSLGWIGLFSQCLYECILVVSNTIGLDPGIAAVTVLAAGTSIPDLLSSYIVARKGEGDMAVSSSIGSNIFDVTVGLPLPWLCFCLVQEIRGKAPMVIVASNSLFFSVVILVLMLAAVIGTIFACRWKLTKCLGYVMLVLYLVFIAQDIMNRNGLFGETP